MAFHASYPHGEHLESGPPDCENFASSARRPLERMRCKPRCLPSLSSFSQDDRLIDEIAGELAKVEAKSRRTGKPARYSGISCGPRAAVGAASAGSWPRPSSLLARPTLALSSPR